MTSKENNNDKAVQKKLNVELTEQNFLMLKHIQAGRTVKDAYHLAGYKGTNPHQPYQMYHRLKKRLEQVYDADNVDSLRLKIEAKRILDMEVEDRPIKPEVKLKAIETLNRLQDKEKTEAKQISPFIVFKADDVQIAQAKGKVIDIKPVEIKQNNAEE